MAQRTSILLLDDLDGETADETVAFALDGVEYEIDLSAEHAEALRESFEEWVEHARRIGGRKPRRAVTATVEKQAPQIRAWARQNGYEVSDRGRVSAQIVQAYEAQTA